MSSVKLTADSGGGTVALTAPSSTTSNAAVELTLPVDDGTSGQALTTNGSGALSWVDSPDDYEEGTWTPAVNVGSATFTAALNNYTKIGRMVFLNFYGTNFSDTSTSTVISITNLPFAPAQKNYGVAAAIEVGGLNSGGGSLSSLVGNNGSNIEFIVTNNDYSQTQLQFANFDGGTNGFFASISYITAS